MVNTDLLIKKDLQHIWHPCMQMKDFENCPPIIVDRAQGSYLYTNRGPLIDGIASWWCKSLGHGHPAVLEAIEQQLKRFEHVISANTTHAVAVELAEQLSLITGKQHIFYASDGSSAVEIAMKLAIHAMLIDGKAHKNQFIALTNGYHGETFGTMNISDLGLYKAPYQVYNLPCHFITPPYLNDRTDSLWNSCEEYWSAVFPHLESIKEQVCAIVLEPIVQGAGGMLCYSPDFLRKIAHWAKKNDIYLIADEIMTGIGRTGRWLALEHAGISADLICLSKGLTSGSIPFSCVMIEHDIYDRFYADYQLGRSFLHSHTYAGNPLALAAALATIKTIQREGLIEYAEHLGNLMRHYLQQVSESTQKIGVIRGVGPIAAGDLIPLSGKRLSVEIYQQGLNYGALLRPIGNTLYWLLPLNTNEKTIEKLAEITLNCINNVYSSS